MYRITLASTALLSLLLVCLPSGGEPGKGKIDTKDWPTYNADVLGTRHNVGEKVLDKDNAKNLVQKWRFTSFPPFQIVGAIHATPVVVNGYVYFGTATFPAVYKLKPNGKMRWVFRPEAPAKKDKKKPGLPESGFLNSVLVTADTVYAAEVSGMIYALHRETGKKRWAVDTRVKPFLAAHSSNCIFSAPILADGKLIIAGGGFEHLLAAEPGHRCCTGRGFVVALDPATGKGLWKYHVGPEPQPLKPPVKIKDAWGEREFHFGPSTSSVWCTPSYDAASKLLFFGTDTHNAPRQPTKDDKLLYNEYSCAVIAIGVEKGKQRWVTQINKGDVWNYAMRTYDPKTGLYKDQSIGDTPKPYTMDVGGKPTRVVGAGCKNGGFYVFDALEGTLLYNTPVYKGSPGVPPRPNLDKRTLALPGAIGGLQTGCATDGKAIYTNGIDSPLFLSSADPKDRYHPPTGGRVVSISLDTRKENWRHEREKVKAVGGTKAKPAFTNVGDPVGSGIALANGVAYFTTTVSNKLVALDVADGRIPLKEIPLGPVWCGPSVSRGRVYVGSGNILFAPLDPKEAYFPKSIFGTLYSFGLPGTDEVDRLGEGDE
jgi:polyvinyl alcohol dehydrogenase (cytochrome)